MGSSRPRQETVTQTQVNTPDPLTQQMRQDLFSRAGAAADQGMPAYYPGQTVAPFSDPTNAALGMMTNYAAQGPFGMGMAQNTVARNMSGAMPGFGVMANAARGGMANPYGGAMIAASGQSNPYLQAMGPTQTTAGMDTLQQTASGGMLNANPYLDQIYNRGANQVQNQVDAAMRRGGMTGSTQHAGAMADALGGLYSDIYAPAYMQERQNQLAAANQLGGFQAADFGRNLGAAQGAASVFGQDRSALMGGLGAASDIYGQNVAQQMAGAGGMFDMFQQSNQAGLRGLGALPGLYDYGLMPAQTMGAAGGMIDAQNQALIDADRQRYDYNANADRNNISWLANMYNGLPTSPYGTQTQTGTQFMPRSNPFMTALGIGSGLVGVGQGLFGSQGIFPRG